MPALSSIIDEKILRIVSVLYKNKSQFYHLTQLALESKVAAATTFRLIGRLASSGLIVVEKVGKLKIYKYHDTEDNNKIMVMLGL